MRYAAIALMELEFREEVIEFIHVILIGNIIKVVCSKIIISMIKICISYTIIIIRLGEM